MNKSWWNLASPAAAVSTSSADWRQSDKFQIIHNTTLKLKKCFKGQKFENTTPVSYNVIVVSNTFKNTIHQVENGNGYGKRKDEADGTVIGKVTAFGESIVLIEQATATAFNTSRFTVSSRMCGKKCPFICETAARRFKSVALVMTWKEK